MLEIVESEFLDLRKSKSSYRQAVAVQVEAGVPDIPLNPVSLKSFLEKEVLPGRIDQALADKLGYVLAEPTEGVVEIRSKYAAAAGFTRLKDLADALQKYESAIIEYVNTMREIWHDVRGRATKFEKGACVYHLSMMLLARKDEEEFSRVLMSLNIPTGPWMRKQVDTARAALAKCEC